MYHLPIWSKKIISSKFSVKKKRYLKWTRSEELTYLFMTSFLLKLSGQWCRKKKNSWSTFPPSFQKVECPTVLTFGTFFTRSIRTMCSNWSGMLRSNDTLLKPQENNKILLKSAIAGGKNSMKSLLFPVSPHSTLKPLWFFTTYRAQRKDASLAKENFEAYYRWSKTQEDFHLRRFLVVLRSISSKQAGFWRTKARRNRSSDAPTNANHRLFEGSWPYERTSQCYWKRWRLKRQWTELISHWQQSHRLGNGRNRFKS